MKFSDETKAGIFGLSFVVLMLTLVMIGGTICNILMAAVFAVYLTIFIYDYRLERQEQLNERKRTAIKKYCRENLPKE